MDLEEITVGDTMTDLEVEIYNVDGTVRNITGYNVRLFLEGSASADRPFSPGASNVVIGSLTTTAGSKTISRAAGSFVTDGVVAGMLIVAPGIVPEGAEVLTVAALSVTISIPASVNKSGDATVRFWFGIDGTVTNGAAGLASFVGVGALLDPVDLLGDTYVGKVRLKDGSNEVGWSNAARGVVKFRAVRP